MDRQKMILAQYLSGSYGNIIDNILSYAKHYTILFYEDTVYRLLLVEEHVDVIKKKYAEFCNVIKNKECYDKFQLGIINSFAPIVIHYNDIEIDYKKLSSINPKEEEWKIANIKNYEYDVISYIDLFIHYLQVPIKKISKRQANSLPYPRIDL